MIRIFFAAAALMVAQSQPQEEPAAPAAGAGETRNCIHLDSATVRRAVDERTIDFELIGGKTYRNTLGGRCPGLRDAARGFGGLAFDIHGSQLCRGDLVRALDPNSALGIGGEYRTAIPCPLGEFVLLPEQASEAAN